MTYAIVVDACIARAAGESMDRIAEACRCALDSISQNDHRLAMSEPLQREWLKSRSGHRKPWSPYASVYALKWFVDMRSRRRIEWVELAETEATRAHILLVVEPGARDRVEKDVYLVQTALASDKRVLSLDENIRSHFHTLAESIHELCEILWLNPTTCDVIKWLGDGAPYREIHRLRRPE